LPKWSRRPGSWSVLPRRCATHSTARASRRDPASQPHPVAAPDHRSWPRLRKSAASRSTLGLPRHERHSPLVAKPAARHGAPPAG
jgi:hypothetical protein